MPFVNPAFVFPIRRRAIDAILEATAALMPIKNRGAIGDGHGAVTIRNTHQESD